MKTVSGKVNIINRILEDIRELLIEQPQHKYLDLLDDDVLPQYSDSILILSQYEGAMKDFRSKHYDYNRDVGGSTWNTEI